MSVNASSPQRLYLMQVAHRDPTGRPYVCYLVQTGDGKNILIDSGMPDDMQPPIILGRSVVEQLAEIGLKPDDIDLLVTTHFDGDHTGHHHDFPNTPFVVQRAHYEDAQTNSRFERSRPRWDVPVERYQFVEGDTELLPGLELIDTNGHNVGHQSVLVRLPETGVVILAIDAVPEQHLFTADREPTPMDADAQATIASTRKLITLAERENAALVVFGHDAAQWATLKKLPEYYS